MNPIANGNSSPAFVPNLVPIFEPNQVLKNTDLNSIVTYLDSQNRLTRTHLIGMGIVCGLEVQLVGNAEIRFTPGCGITSEGFIIEYILATGENAADLNRFTHYREEPIPKNRIITTDPSTENFQLKELISAEEVKKPNNRNISLTTIDLTQQAILILCNWDDVGRDSCLVDCDGRGRDRNFRLRFFLIDKSNTNSTILSAERLLKTGFEIEAGVSLGSAFQSWFEVPDCQIDRLDKLDNIQNFNDLIKAYYRVCKAGILSIDRAFTQTAKLFNPFLSTFQPTNPVLTNIQARLKEILIALVPIEIANADPFPGDISIGQIQVRYGIQYFYDYLVELIAAFNELKAALFDLMDECPPNMHWFPKYLLAGSVVGSIEPCAPPDIYRHSFYQPPIYNGNHQRKREVHHLYDRLIQMITKFQLLPFYQTPIKITPSRNRQAMLGEQAIPYYYSYPDIYRYWNYDACRKQRAAQLPAYFRLNGLPNQRGYDLIPRIDWADFFRVEGHVGLPLTTAIDRIKRYKDDFNLAFDLVSVRVGAGVEDPNLLQGYFDDLEVEFDLIKADWQQKYDRAKRTFVENSDVLNVLANFDRYFFQHPDLTKIDPSLMENDFLTAAQDPINYEFRSIRFRNRNTFQLVLNIRTTTPFRTALVTRLGEGTQIQRATRFVFIDPTHQSQNQTHILEIFAADFATDAAKLQVEIENGEIFRLAIDYGRENIELVGTEPDLIDLPIRLEDETPYYSTDNLIDRYHDFDALFAFLQYFGLSIGNAAMLVSYYEFRALFHRYRHRLAAVKKMQLLTEYAKHHRGLEHLGGVQNGGTLVLVYTSDPVIINNLIASDSALIEISDRQIDSIQTQAQLPLDRLLQTQRLPAITNDRIGKNVVIADFCLPYLCCSPYSSLDYIVSKPKPFIALPKPVYCEGDTNIYDFILDPPGGLLKGGDGIVDRNGNYAFQPSAVDADVTEPMNLTFFYIVDGVGSSYSILLLPHIPVILSIDAADNICVLPGEENQIYLSGTPIGGKIQLSIDDLPYQDIAVTENLFNLGSIIFPADKDSLKLRFIYILPNTDDYCGGTSNPNELVVIRKPIAKINYQKDEGGRAIGELIYGEGCSIIGRKIDFNNNGSDGETYQWKLNNNEVSTENSISIVIPYSSTSSTITLIARKFHAGERVCKTEKTETIELPPLNPKWSFDNKRLQTKIREDGATQVILCRIGSPNARQELITVEQPGGIWSQLARLTIAPVNDQLPCEERKQYTLDFTSTPAGNYPLTYTLPDGSSFTQQVEIIAIPEGDFRLTVESNPQIPDRFVINIESDRSQHPELTYTWTITIGSNIPKITQAESNEFSYDEFRPGDPISVVMEIKDPNSYCVFTSKPQTSTVPMQVTRFELYKATIRDRNNVVWERISTRISNGDNISIAGLKEVDLNIRAVTLPDRVGSVVFELKVPRGQTAPPTKPDNKSPYDLYRNDDETQAVGWRPSVGSYTITAIPYPLANGEGTQGQPLKVTFTLQQPQ